VKHRSDYSPHDADLQPTRARRLADVTGRSAHSHRLRAGGAPASVSTIRNRCPTLLTFGFFSVQSEQVRILSGITAQVAARIAARAAGPGAGRPARLHRARRDRPSRRGPVPTGKPHWRDPGSRSARMPQPHENERPARNEESLPRHRVISPSTSVRHALQPFKPQRPEPERRPSVELRTVPHGPPSVRPGSSPSARLRRTIPCTPRFRGCLRRRRPDPRPSKTRVRLPLAGPGTLPPLLPSADPPTDSPLRTSALEEAVRILFALALVAGALLA